MPWYWENVILFLIGWGLLMAVLLARRNWKMGRVDRKGAFRVGIARFTLGAVAWIGRAHFVPNSDMLSPAYAAFAEWVLDAVVLWMLYLALEPALRARWPHSIVTWNRLLAGRWNDAQVGAHILIGAVVGAALWIAADLSDNFIRSKDTLDGGGNWFFALGTREWLAGHAEQFAGALASGLIIFFCMFGMKMLFRNDLIAAIVAALLFTFSNGNVFNSQHLLAAAAIYITIYAVILFLLLRLGLVATIAMMYFLNTFNVVMLGFDWTTWYAPSAIATIIFLLGIAIFAFRNSLGDRQLLASE
jgi:serine/threonine-protein kinase